MIRYGRFGGAMAAACLSLAVTACGGGEGGVSSTPTPTPTATSTPPPVSGVNTSLVAPLKSETFANTAAAAAVSYDRSGNATSQSISAPAVTFAFNASSNTYTVTTGSASQVFGPASMTSPGNYRVASATITDDLTLTPTGQSSGPAFEYVGAGFWQRQVQRSDGGIDGSITSVIYGVPTASLVRTGTGAFETQAIGAITRFGALQAFRGSGTLLGNFETGSFQHTGDLIFVDPASGATVGGGTYSSIMTLSATDNLLTGSVSLSASPAIYGGSVQGKFYGPAASEFGATFSARDAAGSVATGAFLGRSDASQNIVPLDQISVTTPFQVNYYGQNLGKGLTYNPASQAYTVAASSLPRLSNTGPSFYRSISQFTLGLADKADVQPDARFVAYNGTVDGRPVSLQFYRAGATNSEIQLSYTSFYRLELGIPGTTGNAIRYALYGIPTPSVLRPRTGAATYQGPIYGAGEVIDGRLAYRVSGQSTYNVNFAGLTGIGLLQMQMTSVSDGSVTPLNVTTNLSSGFISTGASTNGYVTHTFFGPAAEELGVSFGFYHESVAYSGVSVAKKQ